MADIDGVCWSVESDAGEAAIFTLRRSVDLAIVSGAFCVVRGYVFGLHGCALTLTLSRLAGEGTYGGGRGYFFVGR